MWTKFCLDWCLSTKHTIYSVCILTRCRHLPRPCVRMIVLNSYKKGVIFKECSRTFYVLDIGNIGFFTIVYSKLKKYTWITAAKLSCLEFILSTTALAIDRFYLCSLNVGNMGAFVKLYLKSWNIINRIVFSNQFVLPPFHVEKG